MNNAGNALSSGGAVVYGHNVISTILDVTNASTFRANFSVFSSNGASTGKIQHGVGTRMSFIKLGET